MTDKIRATDLLEGDVGGGCAGRLERVYGGGNSPTGVMGREVVVRNRGLGE